MSHMNLAWSCSEVKKHWKQTLSSHVESVAVRMAKAICPAADLILVNKQSEGNRILKYYPFCLCVSCVPCVLCVSRLSVRVVWSVCHCVSSPPPPLPDSHPRGHWLPVHGGHRHCGFGCPPALHQQEAVFLSHRWAALSGAIWPPEETTRSAPGVRWVAELWMKLCLCSRGGLMVSWLVNVVSQECFLKITVKPLNVGGNCCEKQEMSHQKFQLFFSLLQLFKFTWFMHERLVCKWEQTHGMKVYICSDCSHLYLSLLFTNVKDVLSGKHIQHSQSSRPW